MARRAKGAGSVYQAEGRWVAAWRDEHGKLRRKFFATREAMSRWRTHAEHVIRQALAEAAEQGLDEAATVRLVDSRYPFGAREYHPYTMWLKVRRELVPGVHEKAQAREAKKIAQAREQARTAWIEATGQEELPL